VVAIHAWLWLIRAWGVNIVIHAWLWLIRALLWLIRAWGVNIVRHCNLDSTSAMERSSFIDRWRKGPHTSTAVFCSAIPYNPTACEQRCIAFEGI